MEYALTVQLDTTPQNAASHLCDAHEWLCMCRDELIASAAPAALAATSADLATALTNEQAMQLLAERQQQGRASGTLPHLQLKSSLATTSSIKAFTLPPGSMAPGAAGLTTGLPYTLLTSTVGNAAAASAPSTATLTAAAATSGMQRPPMPPQTGPGPGVMRQTTAEILQQFATTKLTNSTEVITQVCRSGCCFAPSALCWSW